LNIDKTKDDRATYQSLAIAFSPKTTKDFIMAILTQDKPQTLTLTYFDGKFDAVIGLPPITSELGSDYYRGYLAAVIESGCTPF
jgi:hypothetical protein